MDPVSVIGIGGFVITLIDALGKTIEFLHGMHGRWQDAELFLLSLSTQLGALKAALAGIQSWLASETVGMHYLLQMELDSSATCCQLLIKKVDAFVRGVQRDDVAGGSSHLNFMSRAKMALSGSSMEDVLRMIDRQTNSMNLLLTASSNTLASQKSFLGTSDARNTLKRAKKDTASLYVLRDADSFLARSFSRLTGVSSKLSMVFEFDSELFRTKVYDIAHRASLKETIRRQQHTQPEDRNSREIDKTLKDHHKDMYRTVRLLLWGDSTQRELFQRTLALASPEFGNPASSLSSDVSSSGPDGSPPRKGIREAVMTFGPLIYHFIEPLQSGMILSKWIHFFDNASIVILVVDLRSYMRYNEHGENQLSELSL
ncbi:hypothetical protein F5Y09DRAFT_342045 [Xylaria sp. FL1042]|nr:hypothetical protein F5Y09DRAFT_342045 [Xylaria sp. FL1042]